MKVIIVGTGIAGLSAAIGLRRAGHDVQILEKSSMLHEVGAAINVCPNASRVLLKWGFSTTRARLVEARMSVYAQGGSLKANHEVKYEDMVAKYGAPFYFAHRVDLHNELKHLATAEDGIGKPAEILLKTEVCGYEPEEGVVQLVDGTTMKADMIVGADGIHSEAVKYIIGYDNPAVPVGLSCFRLLLSSQEIIDDTETATLMENYEGAFRAYIDAKGKRVIWYPCRGDQVINLALMCPDQESLDSKEGWNIDVDTKVLMDEMEDFHPSLQAVFRKAKDVKLWKLLFRAPIPQWHKSRLVIIGDAAHPMLPFQGQAGAQAIEDGAALEVLFSQFDKTDAISISSRLDSFEHVRRNRASAMQMFSNAAQDEPEKIRESVLPYVPDGNIPTNPKEYTEYNFSHNVITASEAEMAHISASSTK